MKSIRRTTTCMVMRRGLHVLMLLLALAGRAPGAEGEYRKLPHVKLSWYGDSAPITFPGRTVQAHEKAIRKYLSTSFPDLDMAAPTVRKMVEGMALMIKGWNGNHPHLVGKYYNQVIDAYNNFEVIEKAIAASKTPEPFKDALRRHYAEVLIKRGARNDAEGIAEMLLAIPAAGRLVKINEGETLAAMVTAAMPGYKGLSPMGRREICNYLARINPAIRSDGWYRAESAAKEDRPHVALPVPGKGVHVNVYSIEPGADILIPPAAFLDKLAEEAKKAAPPGYPGMDPLTCAVVKRADPNDSGLAVLSFTSAKPATLCDYTVLTIPFDNGPIWKRDPFATTPALNCLVHSVDVTGLKVDRTALKGNVRIPVVLGNHLKPTVCRYTLDVRVNEGKLSGTFTCRYTAPLPEDSAKDSGRKMTVSGAVSGHVQKKPDAPAKSNMLAPGSSFSAWRGSDGSASTPPPSRPMVDALKDMRLVWRSADYIPTARPSWPLRGGGFASPLIAHNNIYTFYYVPSGSYYNEGAIKQAIASREKHKNPDPVDRDYWRVDADDVFHCLDANTGWSAWRTAFKEQGVSYRKIGAGSEKSGGHLTPVVSIGQGRPMCYAVGTAGKVFAVDAITGDPVWQSDVGSRAETFEFMRMWARKNNTSVSLNRDFGGCAMVADDVVACNNHVMYQGGQRIQSNGMVGFDRFTGRRLWKIDDCLGWFTTPGRWRHKGKEYFVAVGGTRSVCVEPATGRVLWEIRGLHQGNAPALCEDYLVCDGSPGSGITAFRITPQSAEKAWSIGRKSGLCCSVIMNGHVYAQSESRLLCIELESGKVVGSIDLPGGVSSSLMGSGNRIVRESSAKASGALVFVDARPNALKQLGGRLYLAGANTVTPTILDGRMFFRTLDSMNCYDLRRPVADSAQKRRIDKLMQALDSRDPQLRRHAIAGLGNAGSSAEQAVPALTAMLESGQAGVWEAAAGALARIGPKGRRATVSTVAAIVRTDEKRIRQGLELLSRIAPTLEPPEARIAVDAALHVLSKRKQPLKIAAIKCLGAYGPDALPAIPALENAFLESALRPAVTGAVERIRPGRPVRVRVDMEEEGSGDLGLDMLD